MKKILYLLSITFILISFSPFLSKDYVTISGKISNHNSKVLVLHSKSIFKKIQINSDGTFTDTLKVTNGYYRLSYGVEALNVYLKNGFELNIAFNMQDFNRSINFKGIGSEANNYLASKNLLMNSFYDKTTFIKLSKTELDKKLAEGSKILISNLSASKNLDTIFEKKERKEVNKITDYFLKSYSDNNYLKITLAKGSKSPDFLNYENYNGGTISLSDLKGKYVYIDLWATWCGPCKGEVPFLRETEKAYLTKNIEFISISVDETKDYNKWRKMVKENALVGLQLLADKNLSSEFIKDYKVNSIPRFILLDPKGNIISANAPRPSSKDLKVLLDDLLN